MTNILDQEVELKFFLIPEIDRPKSQDVKTACKTKWMKVKGE